MALSGGSHGRTEAVVTCPGEIDDPNFPQQCSKLLNRLQRLLGYEDVNVVKCEPWNSVKITFDLPAEAAEKLSALARTGDDVLREMGILSLQIQGGQIISMTVMSDEELRRSKLRTGAMNSSDSNPIASSLLVNLLQNKDSASTHTDSNGGPSLQPPADKKRRMQLPPGSNPGATFMIKSEQPHPDCSSAENHRSQPKSASSSSTSPTANTLKGSMLPPPPPASASTSPAAIGASGTIPSIEKSRQILINPNTGVLESGPSESSSEGETDPGESRTSPAAADKALKLKLKLPNLPSHKPAGSSSGPSEGSKEESGPKLPKLILSMRDKTVKAKFSNKNKVESEDESDDNSSCDISGSSERIKMLIAKSTNPKRTLSMDNAKSATVAVKAAISTSSNSGSSSSSNSSAVRVNHVIENAAKGNNDSIIEGSTKTLQHNSDRLNAWAKSLGVTNSRLVSKGAFSNNVINDHHQGDVEADKKLFSTASSKGDDAQSSNKPLKDDDSSIKVEDEVTPSSAGATTTIPTAAAYMNGPSSSSVSSSSSSKEASAAPGASCSSEPSDMDSTSSGPLPLHHHHHQGEPPDSGTHQQGEDSGIESMDTLSEKSPNQGENPYPNEERLERELAVAAASRAQKASPASSSSASPTSTTSTDSTIAVQSTPTTSVAASSSSTTQPQQASGSVTAATVASNSSISVTEEDAASTAAAVSSASEESGSNNHTHSEDGINCNGSNDDSSSENGAKVVTTSIIIPTPTSQMRVEDRSSSSTPELPINVDQPQLRTSPIMVNGHGPSTNGTAAVRPAATAHVVPPGAQLVPVKLVSVSAEGAVRLVRVSPVKASSTTSAASVVAAASAVPPRTVIIKSTASTPVISAATTPLPLHLVTSQPLSSAATTMLKENNIATKDNTSSTVVLVGEASKASPTTPPNSVQLGPSLSIMPVFDTPPAGHQSGSMSMKDVVDSINKKNSLIEAALNSITTTPTSTAVEQPLEIDVKKIAASMATTPARPTRQPMPKRSPLQQVDHSFVGGGSLLKPLLATPSKEEAVVAAAAVVTTAVTVTPSNHVNNEEDANKAGSKRRRRDTDSSTKSDKSDISLLSIESSNSVIVTAVNQSPSPMAVAAKKAKIAVEANKKAANNLIKARTAKGASAVSSAAKVKKLEANSVAGKKATSLVGRAENTRAKAKAKVNAVMASLPPSTTITPATTVVTLDQEVSRRSVRQQTPTPGATPARPPSARQQTPTRTTGPAATAKKPNANSQVKQKANNSSSSSAAADDIKSKRLSASPQGQSNSGSSSIATVAPPAAAVSTSVVTSEKRMKTRSAKASSSTSDENFETKRRRLKVDS